MGGLRYVIFSRKKKVPLSEIIDRLLAGLNEVQEQHIICMKKICSASPNRQML